MNYNKTKIYKIWSPKGDKIYIGSTCKDRLCQRMNEHRNKYKQYKKGNEKILTTSYLLFNEYGLENCFIELIEAKECCNKDEKNQLEGHYIRILNCVNKNIVGRTIKEYQEDNKEKYKKYNKEYREINKEKLKENDKKYREINNDKIKLYQKEYNKEYRKTKIICECSSEICIDSKTKHLKSIKHIKFIENN